MRSLESLVLSKNKLRVLPDCIGDLRSLTLLDLSFNALSSLPPSFRSLFSTLVFLDLSANEFYELPLYLRRFPYLEKFYLKNNPMKLKGGERDGNAAESLRQFCFFFYSFFFS